MMKTNSLAREMIGLPFLSLPELCLRPLQGEDDYAAIWGVNEGSKVVDDVDYAESIEDMVRRFKNLPHFDLPRSDTGRNRQPGSGLRLLLVGREARRHLYVRAYGRTTAPLAGPRYPSRPAPVE